MFNRKFFYLIINFYSENLNILKICVIIAYRVVWFKWYYFCFKRINSETFNTVQVFCCYWISIRVKNINWRFRSNMISTTLCGVFVFQSIVLIRWPVNNEEIQFLLLSVDTTPFIRSFFHVQYRTNNNPERQPLVRPRVKHNK